MRKLAVNSMRKNSRETILSFDKANPWSINWIKFQLDKHLGFRTDFNKGRNGNSTNNTR